MPDSCIENELAGIENIEPINETNFLSDEDLNLNHKSDILNKLQSNYKKIERKLIESFDKLRQSIDARQNLLLNELNKIYADKKLYIETNSENLSPQFDANVFDYESNDTLNILEHLKLSGINTKIINSENSNFNKIKNLNFHDFVSNFGRIFTKSYDDIKYFVDNVEYSISGRGLKQCFTNEEQFFSLKFKCRDGTLTSRTPLSLLDIFIARSDVDAQLITTNRRPSEFQSRLYSSRKTLAKPERDCECKLEFISDGVYEVKYKLNKKGNYTLNILVNKKHIASSPYKLNCLEKAATYKRPEPTRSSTPIKSFSSNSIKTSQNKEIKSISTKTSPKLTKNNTLLNSTKKSTSSNSLLLPNHLKKSSKTTSYLNVPKVTSSSRTMPKKAESKSNIPSSNDDSIMSSVPSILSDSLSNPASPRLSKSNLSNLNELVNRDEEDDFLFQIGRRGRNSSEFMNPQAVCATNDSIYVTDSNNQKIDVFTHSGEYKFSMATQNGTSSLKIVKRPCGIVSGQDNKILVVDYELKCVNIFEENGKYLGKICQNRLLGPKGICLNVACNNQIIVADAKANCVCIFDSEGKFLSKFGNLGSKNENFAGPQYVACMSNGDICVTDFYNHCIKLYDCNGVFKFSFGSNGSNQGQFNGPTGIAVDSNDNIIIVDWGNSRVQVFDKHGVFIRYIRCQVNQLYGPQDLAVINNTIAIADSGNHCVKIFEYS